MSTNNEERGLVSMSDIAWFKNEVELVNEFLKDTAILIATSEAYDEKISLLVEKKAKLEAEVLKSIAIQSQIEVLDYTLQNMEKGLKENLQKLKDIKESYMAQELLDTIETLTSAEEGEQLSDVACEVIKVINLLARKYNMGYIG